MDALKLLLAAALAFGAGWGVHSAVASPLDAPEVTAPTAQQIDEAKKADVERAALYGGKDKVITPLNVRDPAALVMGPSASSARCLPAKPCDCAEEKLKKARREQPERF